MQTPEAGASPRTKPVPAARRRRAGPRLRSRLRLPCAAGATALLYAVTWWRTLGSVLATVTPAPGSCTRVTFLAAPEIEGLEQRWAELARAVPPGQEHDAGRFLSRGDFHALLDRNVEAMGDTPVADAEEKLAQMLPLLDVLVTDASIEEMSRLYGTPAEPGRAADMEVAVPVDASEIRDGDAVSYRFTYRDDRGGESAVIRREGTLSAEEAALLKILRTTGRSRKARILYANILGPRLAADRRRDLESSRRAAAESREHARLWTAAVDLMRQYRETSGTPLPRPGDHARWFLDLAAALERPGDDGWKERFAARADAPPGAAEFLAALGKPRSP